MRVRTFAGIFALLALLGAGCGQETPPGAQNEASDLSGTIAVDGSSTVFPVTEAVAEEFQKEYPEVRVTVGQSGTGGGFKKFCNGETQISDASRPIKDEEKQACTAKNIEPVELKIAIDGLSVVVNPKNTFVKCLTLAELKKIWEPGSKVKTWKDVNASWPADTIKLYGPGADSGTFDYFTDEVNGEEGASRSDYTASEDDNVLVQGVAGDTNALGYFGYAYYVENKDKIKTAAVDGGDGCVSPTVETIEGGTYTPLSRPIFIYPAEATLAKPEVAAFVEYYLDNVSALVPDVGYIALPESDLEASKSALETAMGG